MPVISVAIHPVSSEQKKSLIAALTRSAAEVTKVPEAKFIVLLNELPEEAIGVGGRTLKEIRAADHA
jgi:4-oxalocrotonate tautomerase